MASGFAGQGGSFGASTVGAFGSAANDLFSGIMQSDSLKLKAKGDIVEGEDYTLAAQLAGENEQYTEQSTAVKQAMATREIDMALGGTTSAIAGGGFEISGSGLDILKSNAQQGALQKQLIGQQGLITEEGYKVAQQQYTNMAGYAKMAADTEMKMAAKGKLFSEISAGIKIAGAVASMA